MRKTLTVLLFMLLIAGLVWASPPAKKDPYDLQVKKLYAAPDEESNLVYNIPIEVKLLDVSDDGNWYKVQISFNLGPLGYTYVGWTQIPVGEILASRTAKVAKAPVSEPTE